MTDLAQTATPSLPAHFTARPATMEDMEACLALFNLGSRHFYGTDEFQPEMLQIDWNVPDFNIATNTMLVLNANQDVVGYAELFDNSKPPAYNYGWMRVHPSYFNDAAVNTYLIEWMVNRAKLSIAKCDPDLRVAVRVWGDKKDVSQAEHLQAAGFQIIRHWWTMRIDRPETIPAAQVPEGIRIVSMRYPEDFERAVWADEDAFQDHWGFYEEPFEDIMREMTHWVENDPHFNPDLWYMAIDEATGEVAATSFTRSHYRNSDDFGYVNRLSVRRNWRGRGLGLALLQHAFKVLWDMGRQSVMLGVDAQNLTGATRLYQRAGMYVERQGTSYEYELRGGRDLAHKGDHS